MNKNLRKKCLNALLLIAVFALTVWSVLHGEDLGELWEYLQMANDVWLIPAVGCVLAFIVGEAVVILYLMRTLGTRPSFGHCCLYSFIGFFYSCITPSASGGQPMQAIAMRRDGLPLAVSTVVLAIVTITYKLVLVVIGAVVMVLRPEGIMVHLEPVEGLVYLGMALNVGCVALLLAVVFRPGIVHKCAEVCIRLMHRIRPFQKPEKLFARLDRLMGQYTGAADYFRSHKRVMVNVFLITLAQRMCLFLVTWFAYRAFGLRGDSLITVVTLQAMISVAVDMLPLPGGMGISENLFLEMFLAVFGAELVLPGMVISRGISYYTQLVISAVMTLVASFVIRKREGSRGIQQ